MTSIASYVFAANQQANMRASLLAAASRCYVQNEPDWWSESVLRSADTFAVANQFALDDEGLEDTCQYSVDQAANFLLLVREQL